MLFVCLGNICRSPLAEAAFRAEAERLGLEVDIDSRRHRRLACRPRAGSAGAGGGGAQRGRYRASEGASGDGAATSSRFDHIVALDAENFRDLQRMKPAGAQARRSRSCSIMCRGGRARPSPILIMAATAISTWPGRTSRGRAGAGPERIAAEAGRVSGLRRRVADADRGCGGAAGAACRRAALRSAAGAARRWTRSVAKGGAGVAAEAAMLRGLPARAFPPRRSRPSMTACCCSNMSPNDGCSPPEPGRNSGRRSAASTMSKARATAGRSIIGSARSRSTIAAATIGPPSGASSACSSTRRVARPAVARADRARSSPRLPELLPALPAAVSPPRRSVDRQHPRRRRCPRRAHRPGLLLWRCRGRPRDARRFSTRRPTGSGKPMALLEPGWRTRRPLYQLFPALLHLRLFGARLCRHGRAAARRSWRLTRDAMLGICLNT